MRKGDDKSNSKGKRERKGKKKRALLFIKESDPRISKSDQLALGPCDSLFCIRNRLF
jgi:hypothetical protein